MIEGDTLTVPRPATSAKVPSATRTLSVPEFGAKVENNDELPVMWSVAPVSRIHGEVATKFAIPEWLVVSG